MVKSESEIKKMTKTQLKQWLTKHDQRLPTNDQLKKYYFDRAIKYLHLLQNKNTSTNNNNSIANRSRSRKKKSTNSVARTKKKQSNNASNSLTPTKNRNNSKNNYNPRSPSPSPSLSKKRIIRVRRKTPTRLSPSLTKSLKKKRDRMRRATADPANLSQIQFENENRESSSDHSSNSENGGAYFNRNQRNNNEKNILDNQPEKMTINNLQNWLRANNISFANGQKKIVYVNLVKRHLNLKKRNLSPKHKKYNSPQFKKPKSNSAYESPVIRNGNSNNNSNNAPLPRNLRKSPLTPTDDDHKMHHRARIMQKKDNKSGGLLLTPALNKKGVSRITTPSKLQMRDEIRNLLELDGDENPLYPVSSTIDTDNGITPGGPSNYDANVLNDVLKDIKKQHSKPSIRANSKQRRKSMVTPNVRVYDPKKQRHISEEKPSLKRSNIKVKRRKSEGPSSFINSIMAKFSPVKSASPHSIQNEVNNVLNTTNKNVLKTTNKKKHKNSFIAKRTVPSPVNDDDDDAKQNVNDSVSITPNNHIFEEEPMSPAITQPHAYNIDQSKIENNVRRSQRLENKNKRIKNKNIKKKTPQKHNIQHVKQESESPGIVPSIPTFQNMPRNQKNNLSPMKLPFEVKQNEAVKKSSGRCYAVIKVILLAILGVAIAWAFVEFDGMDHINNQLNVISEWFVEEKVYYCDLGKNTIESYNGEAAPSECQACPEKAVCSHGEATCESTHIWHNNKCIMDRVLVKMAWELQDQIGQILSDRRGKYECGELPAHTDYAMSEEQLLSVLTVFEESKKMDAFKRFKKNIFPESDKLKRNHNGKYYSNVSTKSAYCRIREWAWHNMFFLMFCCVITMVVFGGSYRIWSQRKKSKWEKAEVDKYITKVYDMLEDSQRFNNQRWVPVDVIKQRIQPKNSKLWQATNALIQKNANFQKSIRMIDGMQKRCLALASVHSINNNNMNNMAHWSPAQPQQPQWNFARTNNNNNNNNDSDAFNFMNSNQMRQSNNHNNFDNDKSEQTVFPPHSKRSMW